MECTSWVLNENAFLVKFWQGLDILVGVGQGSLLVCMDFIDLESATALSFVRNRRFVGVGQGLDTLIFLKTVQVSFVEYFMCMEEKKP